MPEQSTMGSTEGADLQACFACVPEISAGCQGGRESSGRFCTSRNS